MKELKMLGRSLSNAEQKKIYGGVIPPDDGPIKGMVGWRLDPSGNCYCDFLSYSANVGQWVYACEQSCPVTFCRSSAIDPCPTSVC